MILHTVLFWLKADVSSADRAAFAQALTELPAVGQTTFHFIGRPLAAVSAPVIDASYQHKLVLGFSSQAALDAYDSAEAHRAFIDRYSSLWHKVVVYDAES